MSCRVLLWCAVSVRKMKAEGLEPTALEDELLVAAAALQDRILQLEEAIEVEGLTSRSKSGVVHLHPAVAEARQTRSLLRQVLAGISMEDSVKDRTKQKAANVRWLSHNIAKLGVS